MWTRKLVEDRLAEAVKLLARHGGDKGLAALAIKMNEAFASHGRGPAPPIVVSLPEPCRDSLRRKCGHLKEQFVVETLEWGCHAQDGRGWAALLAWVTGAADRRIVGEMGVTRQTLWLLRRQAAEQIAAALNCGKTTSHSHYS